MVSNPMPHVDRAGESETPRLAAVFQLRASARRLPSGQCVRGRPTDAPFATSESTPLPSTGGHVVVQLPHRAIGSAAAHAACRSPIAALVNLSGKPDAGNPPVRFDEGDQGEPGPYSTVQAVGQIAIMTRACLITVRAPTASKASTTRSMSANALPMDFAMRPTSS